MSASHSVIDNANAATYSNATQQTLSARTITENSGGFLGVRVTARRVSDGATKVFDLEYGFKRDEGDVIVFGLNLLGVKGTVGDLIALAAVSATVDDSGSDTRIRVTGLASTEIDWAFREYGEELNHV